jgi:V/A-type H+-transporting ATPase subunit I
VRESGFSITAFPVDGGTAAEGIAKAQASIEELELGRETLTQMIVDEAPQRDKLKLAADTFSTKIERAAASEKLLRTEKTVTLTGWVPAEKEKELAAALEKYDCAWETEDPVEEEYPEVPVKLKNNRLTSALNMVTEMYSLPAYDGVDPNPLMTPFFIFFYGFMMADMGYGLVMMLASIIIMKKAKPDGPTMRYMIPLLGWCGLSTFIMGAVTGGFFGDLLPQLAQMLNPNTAFTQMPRLFSPLDDALAVLIGSLALGVVQIFTGMIVNMYRQIKRGETMAALCNEGAWFLVFIAIGGGIALGMTKYGLIAALVIIVLTQGYGKKGILGKLMGIGGSLYNNITGYFSDILSYSRLMALMLAGAVIAQVFNTLGAITGNIVFFFIISMVGNALNFALNLLGCYVHDMRLQCLEFFSRFYSDGGKAFRPLDFNTKYVRVVKK